MHTLLFGFVLCWHFISQIERLHYLIPDDLMTFVLFKAVYDKHLLAMIDKNCVQTIILRCGLLTFKLNFVLNFVQEKQQFNDIDTDL